MNLVKGQRGKMGGVIVRILAPAKDLFLGCENAHHGEHVTVDLHFLAHRGVVAKEFLGRVRAQNHHVGRALRLLRGKVASLGERRDRRHLVHPPPRLAAWCSVPYGSRT